MSANLPRDSKARQLDRPAEAEEQITPDQVQDADRMARLLMQILKDLSTLRRRFWPNHVDFEDIAVDATGTAANRFTHGLNGRVRWWVVDWAGAAPADLSKDASSNSNTLVLVSRVAGTATIRVEEAG